MNRTAVALLSRDPALVRVAQEAADQAFGAPAVRAFASWAEFGGAPPAAAIELLLVPAGAAPEGSHPARKDEGVAHWAAVPWPAGADAAALAPLLRMAAEAQRLRQENARLRGDLAAVGVRITHDLRAPLGAVVTAAHFVEELLKAEGSPHAVLIQPIVDSSEELVALLRKVSLWANASAGRGAPRKTGMGPPVWTALQGFERQIAAKGARITQPGSWPEVHGDPTWLEAIWGQLLANALRYGGPAPQIELGWEKDGADARFWVRDRGPGVAAAKQPGLFYPFHRLHETNAPRGLGLPIVRRLVELQDGRCEHRSPEGGGAEFSFILPLA
ncbi:MAG TPA: HAMP domain-containing sensor histidine kinase [Opitutaceae bacterium]|nr:HAMP domain-containing sensor histidine kinase [Opitutaceae bacterium]